MIAKNNTQIGGGRFVRKGQEFTEEEVKKLKLKPEKKPTAKKVE
jgi:hypothetical protein